MLTPSKVPWDKIQTGTDTNVAIGQVAKPQVANEQQNYPEKENPLIQEGPSFVIDVNGQGGK